MWILGLDKMKIAYYNGFHGGHFPHMHPYYKKLGGLVYTTSLEAAKRLSQEYKGINVTTKESDVINYKPDVIMYADYHPWLNIKAKSVMVFHAMENKGYMAVKRTWNYCEKFDLCLLYGDKISQEFKNNGYNIKEQIIGYPRFDDIKEINVNIFNNNKQTILIAPTWSKESLLHRFTDTIIKLSEKYNVIVKPHPASMEFRDDNVNNIKKLLRNQNNTLKVFANNDILPLMKYCDLMVTDVSGCANEYMYFNKPIVIADNGVKPIATGKQPEIWNVMKVCDKPRELIQTISSQLQNDEMKTVRNNHFKQMVHTEKNSTATERGISAIKEVIK